MSIFQRSNDTLCSLYAVVVNVPTNGIVFRDIDYSFESKLDRNKTIQMEDNSEIWVKLCLIESNPDAPGFVNYGTIFVFFYGTVSNSASRHKREIQVRRLSRFELDFDAVEEQQTGSSRSTLHHP